MGCWNSLSNNTYLVLRELSSRELLPQNPACSKNIFFIFRCSDKLIYLFLWGAQNLMGPLGGSPMIMFQVIRDLSHLNHVSYLEQGILGRKYWSDAGDRVVLMCKLCIVCPLPSTRPGPGSLPPSDSDPGFVIKNVPSFAEAESGAGHSLRHHRNPRLAMSCSLAKTKTRKYFT